MCPVKKVLHITVYSIYLFFLLDRFVSRHYKANFKQILTMIKFGCLNRIAI